MARFKMTSMLDQALAGVPQKVQEGIDQRNSDRDQATARLVARAQSTSEKWQAALTPNIDEVASRSNVPEPIAGVSLETYALICRLARQAGEESSAADIAQFHDVPLASWEAATAGWKAKLSGNGPLAARFVQLYEEVAP